MKITCHACGKVINVPDEKIPAGKSVAFNCPACKAPLKASKTDDKAQSSVTLPGFEGVPDTTPSPPPALDETLNVQLPPPPPPGLPDMGEAGMTVSLEDEMEVLEEGTHRALVADEENLDRISPVLRKMQYMITSVKSGEEALRKMEFNFYDLIIVNERFSGCDPNNNPIHKHIEPLNMDVRRKMYLVVIGKNFRTMDNMTAFSKSVNLVMNEADFPNFELILKKSMKENENFYRMFKKALVETGKELE